nr:hypothetical protein Q903MT_gene195 [Picea sitchensis]
MMDGSVVSIFWGQVRIRKNQTRKAIPPDGAAPCKNYLYTHHSNDTSNDMSQESNTLKHAG